MEEILSPCVTRFNQIHYKTKNLKLARIIEVTCSGPLQIFLQIYKKQEKSVFQKCLVKALCRKSSTVDEFDIMCMSRSNVLYCEVLRVICEDISVEAERCSVEKSWPYFKLRLFSRKNAAAVFQKRSKMEYFKNILFNTPEPINILF